MKHTIYLLLFMLLGFYYGCQTNFTPPSNYESAILKIEQISENTYIHTSYLTTKNHGKVPCNGAIFIDAGEAMVFDTPVTDSGSLALINWLETEANANIKAVVVNHFHVDCLGGLDQFHQHAIPSFANEQTIELARADSMVLPKYGFKRLKELRVGNKKVINEYLGAGHTQDNTISYIPATKTLFGGCLIKSMKAGKGNLNDANTAAWANTVKKVKDKYAAAEHVIPGHGKPGGLELLDYTIEMFEPMSNQQFIFFLHNRFLETHKIEEAHPQYGKVEYEAILKRFEENKFKVISEKRKGNVNARDYALQVKNQIDSLLAKGISPGSITVVGTSKGGYIAQYVSTFLKNPNVNFVFVGSFRDSDMETIPEINFCGNILNIYEATDDFGVSAKARAETSNLKVKRFREVELKTGLQHGFLFKASDAWLSPTIAWAKGNYDLEPDQD